MVRCCWTPSASCSTSPLPATPVAHSMSQSRGGRSSEGTTEMAQLWAGWLTQPCLCEEQQPQTAYVVNSGSLDAALQIKDASCLFRNLCVAWIFVSRDAINTYTENFGLWLQVPLLKHWLPAAGSKAGEMQHFLSNCCAGLEKLAQACHRAEALRGEEDWQV